MYKVSKSTNIRINTKTNSVQFKNATQLKLYLLEI